MRILLTGGAGFIGSHLIEHVLRSTPHELVVLDSLTYAGDVSRFADQPWYKPERVRVVWHDLRAPIPGQLVDRIGDVDWVINMASDSHVDRSIHDPVPFIQNNVALATHMLEYGRTAKPKVFVQVSTDEVYGAAPDGYSHAEWDTILPSNPYSASKAAQEAVAIAYWRTYGVPLVITNTMNNFGERQHPEKFLPVVVRHLLAGKPVPLHGQPVGKKKWRASSRVWLHARNHADALLWLCKQGAHSYDGTADDKPHRFNVAGDRDLSGEDIVREASAVLGVTGQYKWVDYHTHRPGHDMRYSLDGSKLRAAGWKPPLSFDESFNKTVRWMADNPGWLGA